MNTANKIKESWLRWSTAVDMPLLVFLCAITYSSLLIKLAGIVFIYVLRPNFRLGINKGRLPLFYLAMLVIAVLHYFIFQTGTGLNYTLVLILGCMFWTASLLVAHQLVLSIERSGTEKVYRTAEVFFLLNSLISIAAIVKIMLETHTINPFMYAGMNYHYHVSTGDHILGLFRDVSTTNSCIMVMAFVFFSFRKKYGYAILSLFIVLLTTSNINNILLLGLCILFLLSGKTRLSRTLAFCYLGIIIFFLVKITPNNLRYTLEKFHATALIGDLPTENSEQRIQQSEEVSGALANSADSSLLAENNIFREISIKEALYEEQKKMRDISADSEFIKKQQASFRQTLNFSRKIYGDSLSYCTTNSSLQRKPGKWISFVETGNYWTATPAHFIFGAGPGNFSSKLAFKASGFGIFGNYPNRYQHISELFKDNHLKILTYFFVQPPDKHSVINTPFSVYNQLIGEYGLLGLSAFVLCYVAFFIRRFRKLSYGRILLPILLLLLITDYWFEQLSVVIIFELLIFADMHRSAQKNTNNIKSPDTYDAH